MQQKIIFIGGGNMAEAIFSKLAPHNLLLIEHNEARIQYLKTKYPNINTENTMNYTCLQNDLVILAIKPQNAQEACTKIIPNTANAHILSIMAGVTVSTLQAWLKNNKITRVMPNMPCILSMGITGIYFSPQIKEAQKVSISNIFKNLGMIYIVKTENDINKITAIASSAPAYVFYFIESLINSAVKNFAITKLDASAITMQVVKGSLALIENQSDCPLSVLRQNITSKGGTTAAAIDILTKQHFAEIISNAELACYNRAIELGNKS